MSYSKAVALVVTMMPTLSTQIKSAKIFELASFKCLLMLVNMEVCITSNGVDVILAYGNDDLLSQRSLGGHFDLQFDHT